MSGQSHFLFVWIFGFYLAYLSVKMEAGDVLPLITMDTDQYLRHLVALDVVVSGLYHIEGNPTPYIPACPVLVFSPLGGEVDGQALNCGILLCSHKCIN